MGASDFQNNRAICFQLGGAISTNATSATTVDTWQGGRGMSHCTVDVYTQADATTAKWTALKLQHGTTTDATNHTDITGAVGTTNATAAAGEFVIPTHSDTAVAGLVRFHITLFGKERFLRVEKQADDTNHDQTADIITFHNVPLTQASASDQGAGAVVYV